MSEDRPPAVVISLHPDPTAPEAVEFFRWLGICVSTWAFIDRRLYQVFHHASGTEQIQSATEFYKDRTFKGRLRKTDRALKSSFNTEEWPAPGSADTELGVFMGPEVSHGETEVYTRVQA